MGEIIVGMRDSGMRRTRRLLGSPSSAVSIEKLADIETDALRDQLVGETENSGNSPAARAGAALAEDKLAGEEQQIVRIRDPKKSTRQLLMEYAAEDSVVFAEPNYVGSVEQEERIRTDSAGLREEAGMEQAGLGQT